MSMSVNTLTVCYIYSREFNSLYVPMISSRHIGLLQSVIVFIILAATYLLVQTIGNQKCKLRFHNTGKSGGYFGELP